MNREQLLRIAEVLRDHSCLIVTDDIYEKLLYVPGPFLNIANVAPELESRTVVINGFSKAFSMTGWWLGYAYKRSQVGRRTWKGVPAGA